MEQQLRLYRQLRLFHPNSTPEHGKPLEFVMTYELTFHRKRALPLDIKKTNRHIDSMFCRRVTEDSVGTGLYSTLPTKERECAVVALRNFCRFLDANGTGNVYFLHVLKLVANDPNRLCRLSIISLHSLQAIPNTQRLAWLLGTVLDKDNIPFKKTKYIFTYFIHRITLLLIHERFRVAAVSRFAQILLSTVALMYKRHFHEPKLAVAIRVWRLQLLLQTAIDLMDIALIKSIFEFTRVFHTSPGEHVLVCNDFMESNNNFGLLLCCLTTHLTLQTGKSTNETDVKVIHFNPEYSAILSDLCKQLMSVNSNDPIVDKNAFKRFVYHDESGIIQDSVVYYTDQRYRPFMIDMRETCFPFSAYYSCDRCDRKYVSTSKLEQCVKCRQKLGFDGFCDTTAASYMMLRYL